MGRVVLAALAAVVVIITLLPFVRRGYWWIRVCDFPRAQVATLGLAVLVARYLLGGEWPAGEQAAYSLVLLSVLFQAWKIFPYTRLHYRPAKRMRKPDPDLSVRVMVANILMDNRRATEFLSIVNKARPDVLCVLEPDPWWEAQLSPIEADYPHQVRCALPNTYGMLIYSRLELVNPELLFRVEEDIPSMRCQIQLRSGDLVRFHCVHPRPPLPSSHTFERDAELLLVGREVKGEREAAIVCGDLNDVAWSYTTSLFLRTSGLLDPRIGRGTFSTFHAQYPFLRYPLDHVFYSPSFRLVRLRRLPAGGSDHFPILIDLCYAPDKKLPQKPPPTTAEERDEAEAMIREGLERAAEPAAQPASNPLQEPSY